MPRRLLSLYVVLAATLVVGACAGRSAAPPPPADAARTSVPLLIAHRGGTGDAPENTLTAIREAVHNGADAIWLTVQLSRDGVPVLYRPGDLSALTDASGPVASKSAAELARLNAGWQFKVKDAAGRDSWPYRRAGVGIPTLAEALAAIPDTMTVVLDMKALPAPPQATAVAQVLDARHAWEHVLIYSTDASYQQAFAAWPRARLFESRDATRERLANVALAQSCNAPPSAGAYAGFEWRRDVELVERFTLGEGRSTVAGARLWSRAAVQCFRSNPDVRLVAFAVNDATDYRAAACAGLDAVLVDSPRTMASARDALKRGYTCP